MVNFYNIEKVNGTHPNFFKLSKKLEDFQFNLMPVLKEKGYNLTENLDEITGLILYVKMILLLQLGSKKLMKKLAKLLEFLLMKIVVAMAMQNYFLKELKNLLNQLDSKRLKWLHGAKLSLPLPFTKN